MKTRYSLVFLTLGLGAALTAGLLWLMGGDLPVARAQGPDGFHTYYVDAGGTCGGQTPCYTTVQGAVDAVDDDGDVVKVAAGTYTGVTVRESVTQVVYISKTVTVRGGYTATNWTTSYPITQPTTLDAQGQGRVIYITGSISPTVEGLDLTGGIAAGLGGQGVRDAGGGVYVIQAAATISGCSIYSNTAALNGVGFGGGLYLEASSSTLTGNTIAGNTACPGCNGAGGGVMVWNSGNSEVALTGNTIVDNIAAGDEPYADQGGGVTIYLSVATLTGNIIARNTASMGIDGWGGGVYAHSSVVTMTGNIIISNTAAITDGLGGGVHLQANVQTALTGNTVASNTAALNCASGWEGSGGGLYLLANPSILVGNTIAGNKAYSECTYSWGLGGGLHLDRSPSILNGNSIISNTADYGGGLFLDRSPFTLAGNSIVGNRSPSYGGGLYVYNSGVFTLTNNLLADNSASEGGGMWLYADLGNNEGHLFHNTIVNNASTGDSPPGVYLGNNATLYLTNTIIAGHTGTGIYIGPINSSVSLASTLWYSNTQDVGGPGLVVSTTNRYGDPAFVDLANGDYHIGADSWALDGGLFAGTLTDFDGDARPTNPARPDAPDLGYDENVSLTVRRPVAAGSVTFGAACARLVFTETGSLSAITLTVEPGRFPTTNPADPVVSRTVTFTPSNSAPFSATLSLCYDDAEVKGGLNESDLQLYRWTGGGWQGYASSVDAVNNVVTAPDVVALSPWTIGDRDQSPTSVRLRAAAARPGQGFGASLALLGLASVLVGALAVARRLSRSRQK